MTDKDKELINQILQMEANFSNTILALNEEKLLDLCAEDNFLVSEIDSLEALSQVLRIALQEIQKKNLTNYDNLIEFILKTYTLCLIKMNIDEHDKQEVIIGEA